MKKFVVNTYLILNLLGAVLGIPLAFSSYFFKFQSGVSLPLLILGFVELLFLVPSFWFLTSSKTIPRRTFLPLFVCYLIPSFLDAGTIGHVIGSFITASIIIYCFHVRQIWTVNKFALISEEALTSASRSLRRAFPVFIGCVVALSISIGIFVYKIVDETVIKEAQGTITLKWDGIYTKSAIFEKGDQKAIVLSMIHYADRSFYESMFERIPNEDVIVLLEGITDRKGLYGDLGPHPKMKYGLTSQFGTFNNWLMKKRASIDSDIDVSDLDEEVKNYALNDFQNGSIVEKAMGSEDDKARIKLLEDRKMSSRNQRMIETFDQHGSRAGTVVFTWGAVHTPYIIKALEERGYKKTESFEQRAISFLR